MSLKRAGTYFDDEDEVSKSRTRTTGVTSLIQDPVSTPQDLSTTPHLTPVPFTVSLATSSPRSVSCNGDVSMSDAPSGDSYNLETLNNDVDDIDPPLTVYDDKISICYGALFDAQIACPNSFGLDRLVFQNVTKSRQPVKVYDIAHRGYYYALNISDHQDFAILDVSMSRALDVVRTLDVDHFQAVLSFLNPKIARQANKQKAPKSSYYVSINIYGPIDRFREVGKALSRKRVHLQHPELVDHGVAYQNPHFYQVPGTQIDMNKLIKPRHDVAISRDRMAVEVEKIMDSLDSVIPSIDIMANANVLTPLLSHQTTAVQFILTKEQRSRDLSLWQQIDEKFKHRITGQEQYEAPSVSAGGILADEMGLGKTLTMLAALVHSQSEAFRFALQSNSLSERGTTQHCIKATLVLVPSAQLIENWKLEIVRHVVEGHLKVVVFHGSGRETDPRFLLDADVVITTYSTLVKDHQKDSVLFRLKWFRLILDEAHWVRNKRTEHFRAVNSLEADRRWCLTGTPLQNKIDDLNALVTFLKIDPFRGRSSDTAFRRFIVDPIFADIGEPCNNLRILLQSTCLRRKINDHIRLQAIYETKNLKLSHEEEAKYANILNQAELENDSRVSSRSFGQKFMNLFTTIMRLRVICDLGLFYDGNETSYYQNHSTQACPGFRGTPAKSPECEVCQNQVLPRAMNETHFCPSCHQVLSEDISSIHESTHENPEQFHLASSVSSSANRNQGRERFWIHHRLAKLNGTKNIFPTKLRAVIKDLHKTQSNSKNIVFSCWTKTLDVLGELLDIAQIKYIRIDGSVSYAERSKRLKMFQSLPEFSTLIMTLGTGALGLNLTHADRIHIVEPQWNPTVEAQAIGRALRLGQERQVTVIRYQMMSTVEQNIIAFQRRKESMAKLTFDGDLESTQVEKLQELREIIHAS